MASHIINNGFNLSVFNRTKEKSEKWLTENTKAKVCFSIEDLATDRDVIILCVGNDNDVRQIINEIKTLIKPGTVVIDHTTTSAKLAKEMNNILVKQGSYFLDASKKYDPCFCLLYTSPSPRDRTRSRMPSSA